MRKILLMAVTVAATLGMFACSKDDGGNTSNGQPIKFKLFLEEHTPKNRVVYTSINYEIGEYLELAGATDYTLVYVDRDGNESSVYQYDDVTHMLAPAAGNNPLYFYGGDTPISAINLKWPADKEINDVEMDQSGREAFLSSDILIATVRNAVSTEYVPVTFKHVQPKVIFILDGTSEGNKITGLTIGGYTAYCDPDGYIKDAQLIIDTDAPLVVGATGTVTIDGGGTKNFQITAVPEMIGGVNYNIVMNF